MNRYLLLLVVPIFLTSHGICKGAESEKVDTFPNMVKSANPYKSQKEVDQEVDKIKQLEQVTGADWLQMSIPDKTRHVFASMYILNKQGVKLRKSQNDYFNAVEEKLIMDPGLQNEMLGDIFPQIVYQIEPGARESLGRIKTKS